jgi:hypothetical protein
MNVTMDEDTSLNLTLIAQDADNDTITYSIETNTTHGLVTINETTGELNYTPESNYFGEDNFTITTTDGFGNSTTTVTVTINDIADSTSGGGSSGGGSSGGSGGGSTLVDNRRNQNITSDLQSQPTPIVNLNSGVISGSPQNSTNTTLPGRSWITGAFIGANGGAVGGILLLLLIILGIIGRYIYLKVKKN